MADAPIQWGQVQTPLGVCVVALQQQQICQLQWRDTLPLVSLPQAIQPRVSAQLERWLQAWWRGRSVEVPVRPQGTELQQKVWQVLQQIPRGEQWSYQEVAEAAGRPRAVRAVANAIGRNPIMLLIPCHRVVRRDGRIGGYHGGVWRKCALLTLEGPARLSGDSVSRSLFFDELPFEDR